MNVYLLRSWTHQQGGTRVGYKPPDGTVAVMLHLGNHPKSVMPTPEWCAAQLQEAGFVPEGEVSLVGEAHKRPVEVEPPLGMFCDECGAPWSEEDPAWAAIVNYCHNCMEEESESPPCEVLDSEADARDNAPK